jgi:hypothetical protein
MPRAITVALALTVLSACKSLQGWRSRLLESDLWTAAESAESLIASGKVPDHGCLSGLPCCLEGVAALHRSLRSAVLHIAVVMDAERLLGDYPARNGQALAAAGDWSGPRKMSVTKSLAGLMFQGFQRNSRTLT